MSKCAKCKLSPICLPGGLVALAKRVKLCMHCKRIIVDDGDEGIDNVACQQLYLLAAGAIMREERGKSGMSMCKGCAVDWITEYAKRQGSGTK